MKTKLQMAMFPPKSDWLPPEHPFPEIFDAPEIAIDVETRDPDLKHRGPGWPTKKRRSSWIRNSRSGMEGLFSSGASRRRQHGRETDWQILKEGV